MASEIFQMGLFTLMRILKEGYPDLLWLWFLNLKIIPLSKIEAEESEKPFFVGVSSENKSAQNPKLPSFEWQQPSDEKLHRTPLYDWHINHKGKIVPFAGWEMPVWYSSVVEEHLATRKAAGLFDVTHMGVYQVEGIDALAFLDSVCGNDIGTLDIGESCYTHFLDPDANVIDDLLVYYHNKNEYLVVVNAANDDKDFAWLKCCQGWQG